MIHGFFVAEWRVKADAVPGIINRTFATPDRLGTFRVLCSALCGPGHAGMSNQNVTKVVSSADFAKWVGQQKKASATAPPAGRRSSRAPSAAAAATRSAAAGTTGTVGPDLGNISADAKAAGQSLPDFIRESIVDPNKYIAKGYPPNVMPGNFGSTLSKQAARRPGRNSSPGATK